MILDKSIPFRYIFNKVKYDLLAVFIVGLIAHYLSHFFRNYIPELPLAIPAFLGTAISILLSFKMNQSYDRWWEARKVWGAIVNDSRSLVLQLQGFAGPEASEMIRRMAYRQIAWCYALGRSLRGTEVLDGLETMVDRRELKSVKAHKNKPLALIQYTNTELRELREQGFIDVFAHTQLDSTLVRLVDSMGKAERINSTIFPSTYRKFLHFIIYVFIVTLTISVTDVNVFFEVPLVIIVSVGFFLIEKSAYHLQDPFKNRPSDVSVTAIARTIEINIRQLLGEEQVPEPYKAHDYYLL